METKKNHNQHNAAEAAPKGRIEQGVKGGVKNGI